MTDSLPIIRRLLLTAYDLPCQGTDDMLQAVVGLATEAASRAGRRALREGVAAGPLSPRDRLAVALQAAAGELDRIGLALVASEARTPSPEG